MIGSRDNGFTGDNVLAMVDSDLGRIYVHKKSAARRFIARWKNGDVHITMPEGASRADFARAFADMKPQLLRRRSSFGYAEGQIIDLTDAKVIIRRQKIKPRSLIINYGMPQSAILVGSDVDFAEPDTALLISRGLKRIAANLAPTCLIPMGKRLAAEFGCAVNSWSISSGVQTLGTCSARREIKISSACMFLPPELREYIICHELAHLTHFDHSARFHALCNRYLNGRERELISKLHHFKWPISR